jgi:hypothetical protein
MVELCKCWGWIPACSGMTINPPSQVARFYLKWVPMLVVIPAQAGIHGWAVRVPGMDSRLRGNEFN